MSNHPNRVQLPYKVRTGSTTVASFATHRDAMVWVQEKSFLDTCTMTITIKGVPVGQYWRGVPFPEFQVKHEEVVLGIVRF